MGYLYPLLALFLMTSSGGVWPVSGAVASEHWDLNDVTYLLPIPTPATWNAFLHPDSRSESGPGLSRALLEEHLGDAYFSNLQFSGAEFSDFTAIAFRIDPCFRDRFADVCRPQVRVVWQPFVKEKGNFFGIDVSLHTFHELTAPDFRKLAQALQAIPRTAPTARVPLGIHPEFRGKDVTRFLTPLMRVFQAHLKPDALSRIALFENGPALQSWGIRSLDLHAGKSSVVKIPTGGGQTEDSQTFVNFTTNPRKFDGRLSNIGTSEADQLGDLSDDGNGGPRRFNRAAVFRAAVRAANPRLHLAGTVDCISCHFSDAAQSVTAGSATRFLQPGDRYVDQLGEFDLRNTSARRAVTVSLRSVGYLDRDFVLIDRVIHESAEVARQMNAGAPN